MKRFLALCFVLVAVLFAYPSEAQITVEEKLYIPAPGKIQVSKCDFAEMVNSLSFKIVEKGLDRKYYDLVSVRNHDNGYQIFVVELKNCKIEQAERNEWTTSTFSSVSYKFILADFILDVDGGMDTDGFRKTLPVSVRVYLEAGLFPSLEERQFFDRLFSTLEIETIKGEMRYIVFGRGKDRLFPQSPGEISSMDIFIKVQIK